MERLPFLVVSAMMITAISPGLLAFAPTYSLSSSPKFGVSEISSDRRVFRSNAPSVLLLLQSSPQPQEESSSSSSTTSSASSDEKGADGSDDSSGTPLKASRFHKLAPDADLPADEFRAQLKENMKADLEKRRRNDPTRGNQPAKNYLDNL